MSGIKRKSFPHIHGANHPVVGASARDMLDRPPNEAGSVLSTTKSYLDLFRDPTIAKKNQPLGFPQSGSHALRRSRFFKYRYQAQRQSEA